ncbi:hypothetical protein GCM10011581_47400 [Saccharopolyspora subtropica]|uniref:Uncharacterized protein n=1 Tax=Saccharopolyspora thermophila TaxID=89367 RepID=A0A917KC03_9PSEU|nr:hypothetical protein GCM10011581_47400 [Saccharopolyspora subtropica]
MTGAELGEAAPVLLSNLAAHRGVLNTAGLAAAGLFDNSTAPPGGELTRMPSAGSLVWLTYRCCSTWRVRHCLEGTRRCPPTTSKLH